MKKNFGQKTWFFPLPVLIIGTYDEKSVPNAMNAAWGGITDYNMVELNLDPSHKTCENINLNKEFTVAFATKETMVKSDYVGMVSGNKVNDKVAKAGLTPVKAEFVNAPRFDEYPVTLECKVLKLEYVPDGLRVVGEILNVVADEAVLTDGNIDVLKLNALAYDPVNHSYYTVTNVVGKAFNEGKKLM